MTDHRLFDEPPQGTGESAVPERAQAEANAHRVVQTRRSALWAAYGDALGFISELTDADGLRRRTGARELAIPVKWQRRIGGRGGVNALLPAGCYSDDTQLRLAVARAISPTGFDVEAFAKVELPVWLAYALGGGVSTKAAATNLAKTTTAWFSNTYQGWLDAGGNGAAMRVQPHVWAASDLTDLSTFMTDVLRDSVCTHANPTALVGATLHALVLAYTMANGSTPEPAALSKLVDEADTVPSLLRDDSQLGELWLTGWEREARRPFDDAWHTACRDIHEAIATAERALTSHSAAEGYARMLEALNLLDPDRRGSGILTAVAATALTWGGQDPATSLAIAANAIGSDTDTIATMAGALLGAIASDEPPGPVMDAALIATEAERLAEVACGGRTVGHLYPDLLTWVAPKSQADALMSDSGRLYVAGLGPIRHTLGDPMPARQGSFQWQWAELVFGQTILIKRRVELPVIHDALRARDSNDRGARGMSKVSDTPGPERRRRRESRPDREQSDSQERATPQPDRSDRPLDLGLVIDWVQRQQDNNASIGYALRRVANEATPEQTAVFLAFLLEILRDEPNAQ